ncbi:phospholipase D-like domain-containing protein [Micromonospora radicis]|uniref:phospholipase D n=1 Tax=Micromonospora radicis TaxID=1894971 RepID=A0A418N1Y2_9ACTN|nr:phospholipase D-like domain-containing protein [Micromonospora radicis]RIV41611.1 phosphatidylserine/phosphatidylglycerophosphate/cardiolipin synthase family protein [Micromonospora radicis]
MENSWKTRARARLALASVATVLLTTAWAGAPAAAAAAATQGICSEQGNYEVCVTYGTPGGPNDEGDTLLVRKIKAKVDATADSPQSGDYIRIAMYAWSNTGEGGRLADALVRAAQRGVSVRVVLGQKHVDPAIVSKLRAANINFRQCFKTVDGTPTDTSCMTHPDGRQIGVMHNKFVLIKKGDTKLVMQSASNLDTKQYQHSQNMLIVRDDSALFSAYVNYWRRLYVGNWTWDGVTWGDDDKSIYGSNDSSRAYFFPQYNKRPLVGVLAGVTECAPGNDRVWMLASNVDADTVYIREIADQLKRLRNIGCDVKVLTQDQAHRNNLVVLQGVHANDVKCDAVNHNKLLLIDAKYAGQWRKAVFVGSYNLTANSNYNGNDAMLRIIDGWVTNRYIDLFRALWTKSAPVACD